MCILLHVKKKGVDVYSYPQGLISIFYVRILESIISKLALCKMSF